MSIAVDASGIKVHNSGDWIRRVWKAKRGYLKIHFAVDVKTKQIVSIEVSSEKVHEGRRMKRVLMVTFAKLALEGKIFQTIS